MNNQELNKKVLTVPDKAHAIAIIDNESYTQAAEILLVIKDFKKEINETFDPIIKKAHGAHKEAIRQKQKVSKPLDDAELIIKPKIAKYDYEQERIRKLEEERLMLEAQKKHEEEVFKRAEEAQSAGNKEDANDILDEIEDVPFIVVPKTTPKIAGISTRTANKWRVKNGAAIKREFLTLDTVKINNIVRSLGKNAEQIIGGIEVYQDQIVN